MRTTPFTLADAFAIQQEHLARWKRRLNPECFDALASHLRHANQRILDRDAAGEVVDPYDVPRGNDLDQFVHNWPSDTSEP
jgi:hypothetical protein